MRRHALAAGFCVLCSLPPRAGAEPSRASVLPLLGASSAVYEGPAGAREARLSRMFEGLPTRSALPAGAGVSIALGVIGPGPGEGGARLRRPEGKAHPLLVEVPGLPPPPAYARTFRRLESRPASSGRYDGLILRHAALQGLDPRLVKAVIAAESEFSRRAVSPAGARGLMQLMPRTGEEMGVPRRMLFDPESNIRAGAAYLAQLFARVLRAEGMVCPDLRKAPMWVIQRVLAAYNAGPRFLYRDRCPRQIRDYVGKVLLYYRARISEFSSELGDWLAGPDGESLV